ncbi:TIGR03618 family F420-dependent PPOX class oxidoreductase [Quadrisphaera sp. DSM 44207]|uniref:TIGR03618 family F420-dependent PPOX class oxidoreductase n=1 Tax=Quadrisphaera sp. DSM 44207 TaxID=1881057 RepID=UPI001C40A18A|nr:TIGR03618 family F420-dependent PPOX class oxidoreductase [Quadrisphaera sp. DSM 44207]
MDDAGVRRLFEQRNHAVISTLEEDGAVHSTVVWVDLRDGRPAVNSAVGRRWPDNLERDPRATLVVYDESNPYEYVEVRGRARGTTEGADAHIDRLAKKYLDADAYPFRQEGEQRITYLIEPSKVRHQKQ